MRFIWLDILIRKRRSRTMFQFLPITDVYAREIFDSQGNSTIEVEVVAGENCLGKAQAPSGALKNNGKEAVAFVNDTIARELMDVNVFAQCEIDKMLDKLNEENGEDKMAVSTKYVVSVAAARSASQAMKFPLYRYLGGVSGKKLPIPMIYIASSGKRNAGHGHIRWFMMVPVGARHFSEAIQMCIDVHHAVQKMEEQNGEPPATDEHGGIIFKGKDEDILESLKKAARKAGYEPGKELYFVVNCSAMENAVWIRPNRIGTVSHAMENIQDAQKEGKVVILAQESGETEDTFLADLSVAMGCNLIKLGAPGKMENVAKYNRLLEIEEKLGEHAEFSSFCHRTSE